MAEGAQARFREQQIRRVLAEHAATVTPAGGLPEIRARIAARPWWRRAFGRVRDVGRLVSAGFASITLAPHTYSKTAAPVSAGAAAKPNSFRELKDMPTIISRHARELHAGDVITHDPDHDDRPVRWRVSRPPVRTRDGEYALTDVVDLATGRSHVTYYRALQDLRVQPAGGAA